MAEEEAKPRHRRGRDDDDAILEPLKDQVAKEVGVDPGRYGGNVPAKTWGALGGHMVKRLIDKGRADLAEDDDDAPSGQGRR
jgi:hypothetical protein